MSRNAWRVLMVIKNGCQHNDILRLFCKIALKNTKVSIQAYQCLALTWISSGLLGYFAMLENNILANYYRVNIFKIIHSYISLYQQHCDVCCAKKRKFLYLSIEYILYLARLQTSLSWLLSTHSCTRSKNYSRSFSLRRCNSMDMENSIHFHYSSRGCLRSRYH